MNILQERMKNQLLSLPAQNAPGEVVSHLVALQAQDYNAAKWSVALRAGAISDTRIEEAIARKEIIRTWPMRGTLHFVAAADIRWMLRLLTPRILSGSAGRHRQLGLEPSHFSKSRKILTKALENQKTLPRKKIMEILNEAGISTDGQRGIHILGVLAMEGLICFGLHDVNQPTFALLEDWIPLFPTLSDEEALALLTLRYFRGHGPATLKDYVWWSGLKISDARRGIAMVSGELEKFNANEQEYFTACSEPLRSSATVCLLPGFDEYLLGYTDRSLALAPEFAGRVTPGNNGIFMPVVLVDGKVEGTWKRIIKKNHFDVQLFPFNPLTASTKEEIEMAAQRYGHHLGLELSSLSFI